VDRLVPVAPQQLVRAVIPERRGRGGIGEPDHVIGIHNPDQLRLRLQHGGEEVLCPGAQAESVSEWGTRSLRARPSLRLDCAAESRSSERRRLPTRHARPPRPARRRGRRMGPCRPTARGAGSNESARFAGCGRRAGLGEPMRDRVLTTDAIKEHLAALTEAIGELLAVIAEHLPGRRSAAAKARHTARPVARATTEAITQ
jgi:hypothetical protein